MAFQKERPDNQVVLFKNEERRDENDPVYKGQGKINGREYWASMWTNKSKKDGTTYLKIAMKPKQEARRETYSRQEQEETTFRKASAPFDDDIPF